MTSTTARPLVTAPPAAGSRGYPFGLSLVDLDAHGYRADEFFLEGEATRYRPAPAPSSARDGRWSAEPAGTPPYRTRVLVYRPVDPDRFNGTVVLHWNNVSAGYELFSGDTPEILEGGYAFAGVTTQRVGVHGLPTAPQGLQAWDPERYGTLSIASDDDSFDIFTQAARAVGPDRDRTTDPLGGLDVRRVIAMGSSQSAGRLGTYVNAIHPLAHAIDAYLLLIYFGSGTPLEVGDEVVNIVNPPGAVRRPRRAARPEPDPRRPRRPGDGRQLRARGDRLPAGAPARHRPLPLLGVGRHVPRLAAGDGPAAPKYERDFGTPLPHPPSVNQISMVPLYDAAPAPRAAVARRRAPRRRSSPCIEFTGDPPEVVRDEHGIARGGIRLPQVDVPIAQNSAIPVADDIFSVLYGSCVPFPPDEVRRLYGDLATRTSPASRRRRAPPRRPACCCPATSRRSSTRLAPPTRTQPASPAPVERSPPAIAGSPGGASGCGVLQRRHGGGRGAGAGDPPGEDRGRCADGPPRRRGRRHWPAR